MISMREMQRPTHAKCHSRADASPFVLIHALSVVPQSKRSWHTPYSQTLSFVRRNLGYTHAHYGSCPNVVCMHPKYVYIPSTTSKENRCVDNAMRNVLCNCRCRSLVRCGRLGRGGHCGCSLGFLWLALHALDTSRRTTL